jgi:ubiquinone/menaquinone biosynthesis C-methylase UbiE
MSDTNSYLQRLLVTDPLFVPVMRSAIQALELPAGSRGLDIGCGIGMHVKIMAEAVGAKGHITGIDIEPAFIAYAERATGEAGLSKRVSFREGNMNALPFDDNTFSWAWSANLIGYNPATPLPPLKEMVRVVRPGGIIAIVFYSSQMLLPGYPLLEAKLNATSSGIAPFSTGMRPELHSFRALGWFRELNVHDVRAQTFVSTVQAPISDETYNAMAALFQMRWVDVHKELSRDDIAEYRRLCEPDSPDFILKHPDYYGFFTYTMFHGHVPVSL